ncbi:MAG: hypothetical protein GX238_04735 [Epulopiscium sp.]|nr:hypothetical protein [Candidatus Epulonipiscium sp.]
MKNKRELKVIHQFTQSNIVIMVLVFLFVTVFTSFLNIIFNENGIRTLNTQLILIPNLIFYTLITFFVSGMVLYTNGVAALASLGFSRKRLSKEILFYLSGGAFIVVVSITILMGIINTIFPKGGVIPLIFNMNLNHGLDFHIFYNVPVLFISVLLVALIGGLIGATFIGKGVYYGLSLIALLVGILIFFMKELSDAFLWGENLTVCLILSIMAIILLFISINKLAQSFEFKK